MEYIYMNKLGQYFVLYDVFSTHGGDFTGWGWDGDINKASAFKTSVPHANFRRMSFKKDPIIEMVACLPVEVEEKRTVTIIDDNGS